MQAAQFLRFLTRGGFQAFLDDLVRRDIDAAHEEAGDAGDPADVAAVPAEVCGRVDPPAVAPRDVPEEEGRDVVRRRGSVDRSDEARGRPAVRRRAHGGRVVRTARDHDRERTCHPTGDARPHGSARRPVCIAGLRTRPSGGNEGAAGEVLAHVVGPVRVGRRACREGPIERVDRPVIAACAGVRRAARERPVPDRRCRGRRRPGDREREHRAERESDLE